MKEDLEIAFFIFLAAALCLHFPLKTTLADFELAQKIKEGADQPIHIKIGQLMNGIFCRLAGQQEATPFCTAAFLLVFPPILFGLTAALLYFSAAKLTAEKKIAAGAALLYAFSLTGLYFLPATFYPEAFSLPFFAFAVFLVISNAYAVAAIVAGAACALNPQIALPLLAFLGAQATKNADKTKVALPAAAVVLCAFLFPPSLAIHPEKLALMTFLLSAGLLVLEGWAYLAAGIFGALFVPAAGAAIIALQAAEAFSSKKHQPSIMLISAFLMAYAFFAGSILLFGAPLTAAAAGALFLAPILPIVVHLYQNDAKKIFGTFGILLLLASIFVWAFYPFMQSKTLYPNYLDPDFMSALYFLSERGASPVAMLQNEKAVKFFLPNAFVLPKDELKQYLLEGKMSAPKAYLVLSLSDFDSKLLENYTSYRFAGVVSSSYGQLALFASQEGKIVGRRLSQNGKLALADGELFDKNFRFYGYLPISRMHFLQNLSYDSDKNRLIVFEEEASYPHFLDLYLGVSGKAKKIAEFGDTSVFEVGFE
ncbi:MAG: hypothetical protein N3G80_03650 [Candidatus Micrarchaeota archaeon]|nr:hypothetical protein [Candidatus Micrarchaeota archaeon]